MADDIVSPDASERELEASGTSKYERRKREREAEETRRERAARRQKLFRRALVLGAGLVLLGVGYWFARQAARGAAPGSPVISRGTIHWHPELAIRIKGQPYEIPKNVGIGIRHETIHTHEDLPTVHLEIPGVVTEDDIRLGRFFKIWGKRFTRECIFEFCNGPEGTVRFLVNGKPNDDFDQYLMRDGDKIEIRYE